jgi:hypothetical protein
MTAPIDKEKIKAMTTKEDSIGKVNNKETI